MPRSSSKLWPPSRAPRKVRSAISHPPSSTNVHPSNARGRPFCSWRPPTRERLPSRVPESEPCYTLFGPARWTTSVLDDGRRRVARLADAAVGIDADEQPEAEDEEDDQ